ncbi:integral membrane protein [Lasiosphaeria hispida]|uniref:Integral membrane protein n=1 Tax=Lasiosphaeria hispida TaxID=260671 RepID=A0AAJ0M8S3_9PEZI|nr:integral membrane protein [Lasiosphaeria hispida]
MVPGNLPDESRAYQIQVPCIIFFIFTPLFVTVRIWARIKLRGWRGLGWDDWTILASWLFATIVSALMMVSCTYGFGQHVANLSVPDKLMTLKAFYVAQAFYKLTINLTKASILLLYLRIFVKKWLRIVCYVLLGIILTYMVATTASSIWQCTPIPRAWDKSIPGTCISITTNWYANAGFSISTDIIILAIPMYTIYTSRLPGGQKVALMVVFALGMFTTVTSILRMQTLTFSSTSPDITWDIESSIWTMIEENLAIICACLPVCRLPLAYIFPTHFSSSGSSPSAKKSTNSSSSADTTNSVPPRPAATSSHSDQSYDRPTSLRQWPAPVGYHAKGVLEKDVVEMSPSRGWEEDLEEGGEGVLLSRFSVGSGTGAKGEEGDGVHIARGIHIVKHYSIMYDDKVGRAV